MSEVRREQMATFRSILRGVPRAPGGPAPCLGSPPWPTELGQLRPRNGLKTLLSTLAPTWRSPCSGRPSSPIRAESGAPKWPKARPKIGPESSICSRILCRILRGAPAPLSGVGRLPDWPRSFNGFARLFPICPTNAKKPKLWPGRPDWRAHPTLEADTIKIKRRCREAA